MLQPNELRIGNLVIYSDENRIFEIVGIDNQGIEVIDNEKNENVWIDLDCFEPIQITEEWLLKFGAKKFPDGESLELNYRLIGFAECRNVYFDKSTGFELKYIHELQNLYFALTQTELTLS